MIATVLGAAALLLWLAVLALPWRPWRTAEHLEAAPRDPAPRLDDVVVLIPARNEAAVIAATLRALACQGPGLRTVLVDDQSADGTADAARAAGLNGLTIIAGSPLPHGWTGKLWAQEQAWREADRPLILLLDADIALAPGTIAALRRRIDAGETDFISLMAAPRLQGAAERLLMPAYIYFFKLLYPFRLANTPGARVSAAAGGCILVRRAVLAQIGGFGAIRDRLIDDCALAARVKAAGYRTWIGLTHAAAMQRRQGMTEVWNMVARTAFTQLRYSALRLAACTVMLAWAFLLPPGVAATAGSPAAVLGAAAWTAMLITYIPVLRYYGLSPLWGIVLPFTALLYLGMTWTSALRYWRGDRSRWKNRTYARTADAGNGQQRVASSGRPPGAHP